MKTPNWFLKKNLTAYLLLPLSFVYFVISKSVFYIRRINQKTSKIPVICVGNILAGGVGKTPIVMQIAEKYNAPVVMRGYKKNKQNDMGDEAVMMKLAGLKSYVGNRAENIKKINKQNTANIIVMDDGFQNPTIKKDVSILVFDEKIKTGNGFMLPAGPLRESMWAINRCDAIIVMGGQKKSDLKFKTKIPVFYAKNKNIMPNKKDDFVAFAGIGYPEKFFNALNGNIVATKSFPDHYQYTKKDLDLLLGLAKDKNAKLVTTQKDWVRLPKKYQKKIYVAKLETIIESDFWKWLKDKIK